MSLRKLSGSEDEESISQLRLVTAPHSDQQHPAAAAPVEMRLKVLSLGGGRRDAGGGLLQNAFGNETSSKRLGEMASRHSSCQAIEIRFKKFA